MRKSMLIENKKEEKESKSLLRNKIRFHFGFFLVEKKLFFSPFFNVDRC